MYSYTQKTKGYAPFNSTHAFSYSFPIIASGMIMVEMLRAGTNRGTWLPYPAERKTEGKKERVRESQTDRQTERESDRQTEKDEFPLAKTQHVKQCLALRIKSHPSITWHLLVVIVTTEKKQASNKFFHAQRSRL